MRFAINAKRNFWIGALVGEANTKTKGDDRWQARSFNSIQSMTHTAQAGYVASNVVMYLCMCGQKRATSQTSSVTNAMHQDM